VEFEKLDPQLAMALEDVSADEELLVFVEATHPLSQQQATALRALGIGSASPGESLATGTLTTASLASATALPFVKSIQLSQRLTTRSLTRP
jgi:hypothetical protein